MQEIWSVDFEITAESEGLSECYQTAAQDNLSQCEACLNRIKEGISVLETDPIARKAFIMANEAMYEQFLHYSVVSGERGGLDEPWIHAQLEALSAGLYFDEYQIDGG